MRRRVGDAAQRAGSRLGEATPRPARRSALGLRAQAPFSLSPPRVPLTLASARTVRAGARWQVAPETTLNLDRGHDGALSARGACLGALVSQGPLQRQFELLDLVGFLFVALPCLHASDGCDAGVAGGHLVVVLVAQGDRGVSVSEMNLSSALRSLPNQRKNRSSVFTRRS